MGFIQRLLTESRVFASDGRHSSENSRPSPGYCRVADTFIRDDAEIPRYGADSIDGGIFDEQEPYRPDMNDGDPGTLPDAMSAPSFRHGDDTGTPDDGGRVISCGSIVEADGVADSRVPGAVDRRMKESRPVVDAGIRSGDRYIRIRESGSLGDDNKPRPDIVHPEPPPHVIAESGISKLPVPAGDPPLDTSSHRADTRPTGNPIAAGKPQVAPSPDNLTSHNRPPGSPLQPQANALEGNAGVRRRFETDDSPPGVTRSVSTPKPRSDDIAPRNPTANEVVSALTLAASYQRMDAGERQRGGTVPIPYGVTRSPMFDDRRRAAFSAPEKNDEPTVHIGRIDVIVAQPAKGRATSPPAKPVSDRSSRLYLRRA